MSSDAANGVRVTGAIVAGSSQGELNGSLYASPEAAVTAACAGSHAVYFPAGTYATTGLPVCSGLRIRCSSGDLLGAHGVSFQVTGANWGLYNPNASVTSGSNAVRNLSMTDCNFDISANPSALGAWTTKGISWSSFIGNSITTNNNPNPAITEDGGNWQFNSGDYDNTFVATNMYNKGVAPFVGTGILLTGSGGSNNNTHVGGSITRMATVIDAESANNNMFESIDAENWYQTGILLTPGAAGNEFRRVRLETNLLPWSSNAAVVSGKQIVDANGNMQSVTVAGTTGGSTPAWAPGVVDSITTSSGCTVVGTVGQTVLLTGFNNSSTATATGTLTLANSIVGATWVITSAGTGATAAPTSATCSAGTASSASGTAAITTTVGTAGQTTSDGTVTWTLAVIAPTDVMATGSNSNVVNVYISGYETGVVDDTGLNTYPAPQIFGATAAINQARNVVAFGANNRNVNVGIGETPRMADGSISNGNIDATGEVQGKKGLIVCNPSGCGAGYTKLVSNAVAPQTVDVSVPPASLVASVTSNTYSATVSTGFTTFYTTPSAGLYRACSFLSMKVSGTGTANWQSFLHFTTDGTAISPAVGANVSNTAAAGTVNGNGSSANCAVFYMDSGTNVQWDISVSGGTPSVAPTLRYSFSLEFLTN
jgi:hypothetical protein